jgi:indole-3-glycerol phosphate synthase
MNILDMIAEKTKERVSIKKQSLSQEEIERLALAMPTDSTFPFEQALKKDGIAFICEIKKASPSQGVIAEDFDYVKIAKEYELAGAAAISVLTEPYWFLGSDDYLKEIVREVKIPVLRKDFTVDSYMIYEAKIMGAAAVLFICALLSKDTLKNYLQIADSLGLSALVEAHDEQEVIMAVEAGARIIGVNNRNLKTFEVDVNNSSKYRKMIPNNIIFVSESGIKTYADIKVLEENKTDAALIGETLMRAKDKTKALAELRGKL